MKKMSRREQETKFLTGGKGLKSMCMRVTKWSDNQLINDTGMNFDQMLLLGKIYTTVD